jgi:lactate dehydrogenase-like 2-hydroxyacid dehydrogenase
MRVHDWRDGPVGRADAAHARLSLVCAMGAGYENIDVAYAKAHGIAVGNGVGTNDDCVADHAMGLLIAAVRGIVKLDKATRAGIWRSALPLPANVSGKRLGIVGLGQIGAKIARRAAAFDMPVGYHNRKPRESSTSTSTICWRWPPGPMCCWWPRREALAPAI